jgi:hypothetical protein
MSLSVRRVTLCLLALSAFLLVELWSRSSEGWQASGLTSGSVSTAAASTAAAGTAAAIVRDRLMAAAAHGSTLIAGTVAVRVPSPSHPLHPVRWVHEGAQPVASAPNTAQRSVPLLPIANAGQWLRLASASGYGAIDFAGNQSLAERETMLAGCGGLLRCGFMAPTGFDVLREPAGYEDCQVVVLTAVFGRKDKLQQPAVQPREQARTLIAIDETHQIPPYRTRSH